jgi:hypothetical protein
VKSYVAIVIELERICVKFPGNLVKLRK